MNARNLIGRELTIVVQEDTADALSRVLDSLGMDLVDDAGDVLVAGGGMTAPRQGETPRQHYARKEAAQQRIDDRAAAARAPTPAPAPAKATTDYDAIARAANDKFFAQMGHSRSA